jgi:hypothetical protein
MPRDGANLLSDLRVPVLTVICDPYGRRERHDVERLIRQYGWDAKLTDLLGALTVDWTKRGLGQRLWQVQGSVRGRG